MWTIQPKESSKLLPLLDPLVLSTTSLFSERQGYKSAHGHNEGDDEEETSVRHTVIMKEVQQSMQTMFKQMHQHHNSDDDSDIDKSHHLEVMEDITVSECLNLSDASTTH
jgi:hypothetical protein